MTERTKYDGKLTDALIQAVVEAENRLNGLVSNDVPYAETDTTPQIASQPPLSVPVEQFSGWPEELAAYQRRISPTPTEQAEAWAWNHRDYEPEPEQLLNVRQRAERTERGGVELRACTNWAWERGMYDWERLEREAEQGRRVLVYLNRLELRKQEDREYVEQIRRVGRELVESFQAGRAKGAGA